MASILSGKQTEKLSELVRLHHASLVVELLGDTAVPPSMLKALKSRGLYRKPRKDVIRRAFEFGREGLVNPKVLSYDQKKFESYLASKGAILRSEEREALTLLHKSFVTYLKSLAETMTSKVEDALTKADQALQRRLAARARRDLFLEVERRKALASIAKSLAEVTATQVNGAVRVIATETNNAYQDGRAQEILRKSRGRDPAVFKRPRPDACEDCVKAYLENDGVTPKIFRLSELASNGSNVGKSRTDRQPVLESFHPFCACELHMLPEGFGFNNRGEMIYLGLGSPTPGTAKGFDEVA